MLAKIKVGFILHDYSHCFDFGIALLIVCELAFMHSKIQVSVLLCCHIIFGFEINLQFLFQFVQRASVVRQELAKLKKSA